MKGLKKTTILMGLVLFALPFLLFAYYSYSELVSKQELQLRKGFEHSAEYIRHHLDSAVHEVKHHLLFIGKNPVLQNILSGRVSNSTEIPLLLSNNIEPYIWYHITSPRSMMKTLAIYAKRPLRVGTFLRAEEDILPLLPDDMRQKNNPGGLALIEGKLCYVSRIYGDSVARDLGLIVGEVDVERLVDTYIREEKEIGFSVTLGGHVLHQSIPQADTPLITVSSASGQTGLTLSLFIPSRHIKLETKPVVAASLIGLVILTLVYLGLLWRVAALEKQVEREHVKWEQMRLKALQAQMNPHFLYNTLSMINWRAKFADTAAVSRITTLISSFYRTALNRGREDISLREEMDNVRSYLELKRIMTDDMFTYDILCPPALMDRRIVNFILQPIVENALIHGIAPKGQGHVQITAREEKDDILITVSDDGVGLSAGQAAPHQEAQEGYGLRSIHERIQLLCGPEYGARMTPSDRGVCVEIRVRQPLVKQ